MITMIVEQSPMNNDRDELPGENSKEFQTESDGVFNPCDLVYRISSLKGIGRI